MGLVRFDGTFMGVECFFFKCLVMDFLACSLNEQLEVFSRFKRSDVFWLSAGHGESWESHHQQIWWPPGGSLGFSFLVRLKCHRPSFGPVGNLENW